MRIISSKLLKLFIGALLLITCSSCKKEETYRIGEYLNDLAYSTGIDMSEDEDSSFVSLREYGIIDEDDKEIINDPLTYAFLAKTIGRFFEDEETEKYLLLNVFSSESYKDDDYVDSEKAKKAIELLTEEINNPTFEERTAMNEKDDIVHLDEYKLDGNSLSTDKDLKNGDYIYLEEDNIYKKVIEAEDNDYIVEDTELDDVFESIDIAGSYEVNFEDAEIIDLDEDFSDISIEETDFSSYANTSYNLLSSKRHTFNKDDYDIAYTVSSSSIDFRITRKIREGTSMYFDTSISSIKPTYKWDDSGDDLYAFFKLNFDITNEVGVSTGKYDKYYLNYKDLDSTSFKSLLKSSVDTKRDALEATLTVCTIKTPIPNIPTATFNIDVLVKFYVSGRMEFVLENKGVTGFEIKDNNFRIIHDVERDYDYVIGASARAVAGLNFNICTVSKRLMDIEIDGGLKASVSTTLHLYDDDGNDSAEIVDDDYSAVYEISKENTNVAVCGDVSLNWVLEVDLNTSKSLLYKLGFSRKKTLLDKKNQLFDNLTHIENFQFVKSCTRKHKTRITTSYSSTSTNSEKIILSKYSIVIIKGNSASVPIKSLPSGYSTDDLKYETSDSTVAQVTASGTIDSEDLGSCKITISTSDGKYSAYLNVLVSTG